MSLAKPKDCRDEAREHGAAMGLSLSELDAIERELGRVPSLEELAIFAGMWSEHCSYKSTKHLLRTLPRASERVLAGPGEHAGVVDVGDGWAVAFKVESHNHPSAVEPYQGAATGVGGILRDIIAQGARPCAVMDSLCFPQPTSARAKHLEEGVVAGIAGYGNAFGVPNVGGATFYDERYEGNPLVNALAAGLVRPNEMRTGRARGPGNAVLYAGAATGRDGILGAAFASEELADDTVEDRPHVQVGDPFAGKKLMEACLSFLPEHGMVACQDMGACGITCATVEMAALGGVGMEIDLDAVPQRDVDMSAHEILLSESQERFLFVVEAGKEVAALAHFRRHGVQASIIGKVTDDGRISARFGGRRVALVPARLVADGAPETRWAIADVAQEKCDYPELPQIDANQMLLELLGLPGIANLERLYSHYDHTVGNRTVRGPGQAEAAVLRLPGSTSGFALVLLGRGDLCAAGPYEGSRATLAEAMRKLACAGGTMVAITDGLNMASPRDPTENRKLAEVVRGLADALRELGVPVTGGNVSLYNESSKGPIPPTPMIGALGIVADVTAVPRAGVAHGELLFLLGQPACEPVTSDFGRVATGRAAGPPARVDLAAEKRLADFLVGQIASRRIKAAKAASRGGLAVALAKLCIRGGCGAQIELPKVERPKWLVFGEYAANAWVSVHPADAAALESAAAAANVPCAPVGACGGDILRIDRVLEQPLGALREAFEGQRS